jgi:hypothetical protein
MDTSYVTRWTREALGSDDIGSNGRRTALGYLLLALEQELPPDAYGRAHVISSKKGLAHCLHVSTVTAMNGRTELLDAGFLTIDIAGLQPRKSWGKPMRVILTIPEKSAPPNITGIDLWVCNPTHLHGRSER